MNAAIPPSAAAPAPLRTRDRIGVVLVTLALGTVFLIYPFGRDQGNYAYAAWAWLEGASLYRDVYVFKPPGTVLVHALALGFGHAMTSVRVLDLLWTAATALLLTEVVARLGFGRARAVVAGWLWAFTYAQMTWWTTAQTDGWMTLPVLVSLWLCLRAGSASPHPRWPALFFAAGLGLGVAIGFKYTAGIAALPLGVVILGLPDWRRRVGAAALVGVGAALVVAGMVGWLVAAGCWESFRETQSAVVTSYVSESRHYGWGDGTVRMASQLVQHAGIRATGPWFYVGLLFLVARVRARGSLVLLAWCLAGLISCVSQGKLFTYHYLYAFPPLAAVAAVGMVGVVEAVANRVGGRWIAAVLAVGLAAGMVSVSRLPGQYQRLWGVVSGHRTLLQEWKRGPYHQNSFSMADDLALVAHLRQVTGPEDRVFLWGFEPLVNFAAERLTVSRFLYNYPFAVSWGNPAYEAELLAALTADPPAAFVVASKDATFGVTGTKDDSRALFLRFDALRAFVAARYGAPTAVTRFDVYLRLPGPDAP